MKCKAISHSLVGYLDGELIHTQQQKVKLHLDACAVCQQKLESCRTSIRRLHQAFETTTRDAVPDPQVWARIQKQISMQQPQTFSIRRQWESRLRRVGGEIMTVFLSGQRKWKLAAAGAVMVAIIVALSLTLPASPGKPATALAEEIAMSSPEVKAALGGGRIASFKTTVSEDEGTVICIAEMQPPIVVTVDLESRKVTQIEDIPLPDLTEADAESAIDLAVSDPSTQELLDNISEQMGKTVSVESVKAFACFASGTVETKGDEIRLLPEPRMAIIEFELSDAPSPIFDLIRIKVDLDSHKVTGRGFYTDQNAKYPNAGVSFSIPVNDGQPSTDKDASIAARGLMEADPIATELLKQGFSIPDENISIFRADNRLDTDQGGSVIISTPTSAMVQVTKGDEKWMAVVDLIQREVTWLQVPDARVAPSDAQTDQHARETALNLLQTDPQFAELMNQGATLYTQLHRGDFEYAPSPESGIRVTRSLTSATAYLVLGDDLWGADIDLKASQLDGPIDPIPDSYQLPNEKKEAVTQTLESQPVVRELLDAGGSIIYIMGGGDSGDEFVDNIAIALIHMDKTGEFWSASISLTNMTFLGLTPGD